MDIVERVIRSLIKEGKLSRARTLLSIFIEDYPHLVLELEIAAGNYELALEIYEKLSDELKMEYRSTMEDVKKAVETRGYKGDFKDALAEYAKGNYQGTIALLEGITKDYPELVEAIALKYETYIKRGDTSKAKEIEEILKRFDASHPALIEGKSPKSSAKNLSLWAILVSIVVLIIMTGVLIFKMQNLIDIKAAIASEVKSEVKRELSLQTSALYNRIETVKKDLEVRLEENIDKIDKVYEKLSLLEKLQKDLRNSVETGLSNLGEREEVKVPNMDMVISKVDKVLKNMDLTLRRLDSLEKKVLTVQGSITELYSYVENHPKGSPSLRNVLVPGEMVYKPSSELDRAKIYWLAGYIMYLRDQYDDAIDLFKKSLDIIEVLYPRVYFHDDCVYYLGLSYYMKMNYNLAKKYFEILKREFPKSQYIDDAEFFMKGIPGGE